MARQEVSSGSAFEERAGRSRVVDGPLDPRRRVEIEADDVIVEHADAEGAA